MGRDGSYGGWHSAHTGIGTLPIVYFGNEQQKQKYLPKLAKVEMLAAYALTEPLAAPMHWRREREPISRPDGKHYILNGQKMWITNGGRADLFTVFAKVGRREVHRVPGRAKVSRREQRRRRTQDGHHGQFHHRRVSG